MVLASNVALRVGDRFILHPLHSPFCKLWEPIVLLSLLFTGVVTPFEVALLHDQGCLNPLWAINRLIDLVFTLDLLITFRTAFYEPRLGRWNKRGRAIAYNYLTGWFVVDLVSVLPLWPIPMATAGCPTSVASASAFTSASASTPASSPSSEGAAGVSSLAGAARVVRLVRLLRLTRMVKAVRVITRQLTDFYMVTMEGTFGGLKFLQLVLLLLCVAHWQACLFATVELFAPADAPGVLPPATWLRTHRDVHGNTDGSPLQNYILALYMSVGILTGLGADDILPTTPPERALNLSVKFFSGCLWAWAIGEAAAIASTLNPYQVFFHNNMDRLNLYLRDKGLPRSLRLQARDYFENAKGVHAAAHDASLLSQMSPLLRGEIALAANRGWIEQVGVVECSGRRTHRLGAIPFALSLSLFLSHVLSLTHTFSAPIPLLSRAGLVPARAGQRSARAVRGARVHRAPLRCSRAPGVHVRGAAALGAPLHPTSRGRRQTLALYQGRDGVWRGCAADRRRADRPLAGGGADLCRGVRPR